MTSLDPRWERRLRTDTPAVNIDASAADGWVDRQRIVVEADDAGFVLAAQVSIHRPGPTASFQCAVFGLSDRPIVIAQDGIDAPDRGWEFRASGLWVEYVCEDPFVHWSHGLEAFAIEIDSERELLGRGYGDRVPLGWEFDFLATGDPEGDGDDSAPGSAGHYQQDGTAEGLLLLASGERSFRGWARRTHRWGPIDRSVAVVDEAPTLGDEAGPAVERVALPTPIDVWWIGRSADGWVLTEDGPPVA